MPDVGIFISVSGVAPDYLTSSKLLIFPKSQVRVREHPWKDGKSKARRSQLNYSQKICSRNRYSACALFFHSVISFCRYTAISCLFTNIYDCFPLWKLNIQDVLGTPSFPDAKAVAWAATTSRMKWTSLRHRSLTCKLLPEPKSPSNNQSFKNMYFHYIPEQFSKAKVWGFPPCHRTLTCCSCEWYSWGQNCHPSSPRALVLWVQNAAGLTLLLTLLAKALLHFSFSSPWKLFESLIISHSGLAEREMEGDAS